VRRFHDLGGLPAGPVDWNTHEPVLWEKRVHALLLLLSDPSNEVMSVDELRSGIESLGAEEYADLTYYERWITSISDTLIRKGVISVDELGRKLAELEARAQAAA
jgi:hypothetical protein